MLRLMALKDNFSSLRQNIYAWFAQQLNDQKPEGLIAPLDGVRALAFLLVFSLHVNHSGPGAVGDISIPWVDAFISVGRTGVTLFFVLSGFLLFLPYTQALLFAKDWPQPKIYYMRRILRIFPGYFFSLFILVMFTKPYFIQPHNWPLLAQFLTFTMGYNSSNLINGPYWTLAVEFQYYLLLPLIAFGILVLTRLVRPEKRLWVVIGSLFLMMTWGLLASCYGAYFNAKPELATAIPHSLFPIILFLAYGDHGKYLEYFAVGMLIAVIYLSIMKSPKKDDYLPKIRILLLCLLIPFIALFVYASMPDYTVPFIPHILQFRDTLWLNEFVFVLCYGYLVTAVLFNRPGGWLVRLFSWTPLRWLGLISYSLYIWHRPLVQILAANLGPNLYHLYPVLRIGLFWTITFTTCVVFCFILFVAFEKPGMRLSEHLRKQWMEQDAHKKAILEPTNPSPQREMDVVTR